MDAIFSIDLHTRYDVKIACIRDKIIKEFIMNSLATTKMSSKGGIIIPEEIRRQLGLKSGSHFVVMGKKNLIILKTVKPLSEDKFDSLIADARKQAKNAGLKSADIKAAVAKVRSRK